jgi:hypothetical protein
MATSMKSIAMVRSARFLRGLSALLATACFMPANASSAEKVPSEIAGLLPSAAALDRGSWSVLETEFGKTFTANMTAKLPGFPSSCDFTVGPELRVTIKGDTAWEEPPMLDMVAQTFASDLSQARSSLPTKVANFRKFNSAVQSVGALVDQEVAGGHIVAMEYTEDCKRRPKGTNTVLRGFARKGATLLKLDLWISADAAKAKTMANEVVAAFQQLDFNRLINPK